MKDKMEVSPEEKKVIEEYENNFNNLLKKLGGFRRQYMLNEEMLMKRIEQAENDYFSYLKTLAKSRGMPDNEKWLYNAITNKFEKE